MGDCADGAGSALDLAQLGGVALEREVAAGAVVVLDVPAQHAAQVGDHAASIVETIFSREFQWASPGWIRSEIEEIATRRTTLIWIRERPPGAFTRIRLLRRGREVAELRPLRENKGLVAVVAPRAYVVEGSAGDLVKRVEVSAEAMRVAEVLLDAFGKDDR